MSDSCDVCGYKSSEIKGGGAISDRGRRIVVEVREQDDLRRDVIKADTASVRSLPSMTCVHLLANLVWHSLGRNVFAACDRAM
jgi:C4-type Zn-finger protein